jgi:hypothetical protein
MQCYVRAKYYSTVQDDGCALSITSVALLLPLAKGSKRTMRLHGKDAKPSSSSIACNYEPRRVILVSTSATIDPCKHPCRAMS